MQRRRFGRLAIAGIASILIARFAPAAPVTALPFVSDLRQDAASPHGARLVVVLFSLPDCIYCEAIRREQLLPLSRERVRGEQLTVREVSITGSRTFVGFDGRQTTESAFAKQSAAKFSPTVAFFGPSGNQVSAPIVGALLADFYGAYLDKAVHDGLSKIGGGLR